MNPHGPAASFPKHRFSVSGGASARHTSNKVFLRVPGDVGGHGRLRAIERRLSPPASHIINNALAANRRAVDMKSSARVGRKVVGVPEKISRIALSSSRQ